MFREVIYKRDGTSAFKENEYMSFSEILIKTDKTTEIIFLQMDRQEDESKEL